MPEDNPSVLQKTAITAVWKHAQNPQHEHKQSAARGYSALPTSAFVSVLATRCLQIPYIMLWCSYTQLL